MKIYTVVDGDVQNFALVEKFALKDGTVIPAIVVGETGRNRRQFVLPVRLTPEKRDALKAEGQVKVTDVALTKTLAGNPKLEELPGDDGDRACCVVFLTSIGFRGGNGHHGCFLGTEDGKPQFAEFPGKILGVGAVAQGDAGNMGWGEQIVTVLPPKATVCIRRTGRLYGAPPIHVVEWDGERRAITVLPLDQWRIKTEFANEAL